MLLYSKQPTCFTASKSMHIHFLDPYHHGQSLIHRLDPRVKLVLTLAFILATSLVPTGVWAVYILLFSMAVSVELLSELGVWHTFKRASLALPFVLAAAPLIFTAGGKALLSVSLGAFTLTISQLGLERFISIALKSWLSVQVAIVLAQTTPFPDLLMAMRAIKIPRLLVATFGLMWRNLFVLVDETLRLLRAREARSGHRGDTQTQAGGSLIWRARVTGGMAGNLFMRAFERGDRIYAAMLARGYDGEVRVLSRPAMTPTQWLVLMGGLGVLGALLGLAYLLA